QEPYRTIPKKLRDYGSKHASRIYGESNHLNASDNYAMDDTESEDDGPEDEHNLDLKSESTENDEIS
ncbi:1954_t:CDS:2, partial [Funneliformis mosseae]